jgi:hypothetical protein
MISAPPVSSFDMLPLVLLIEDIIGVYRIGRSTLRKQLAAGTFRPMPFAANPYRWLKADVQRHLERQATAPAVRSARGRKKRTAA